MDETYFVKFKIHQTFFKKKNIQASEFKHKTILKLTIGYTTDQCSFKYS